MLDYSSKIRTEFFTIKKVRPWETLKENVNPETVHANFMACNDVGLTNKIKQGCVHIMAYCGSEH